MPHLQEQSLLQPRIVEQFAHHLRLRELVRSYEQLDKNLRLRELPRSYAFLIIEYARISGFIIAYSFILLCRIWG